MWILLEFTSVWVIFFIVSYITWYITEKDHVPEFLEYKPFQCRLCLNFWSLVAIYLTIGISFKLWVVLIAGIILAIMNAGAMWINQKNKTIKV